MAALSADIPFALPRIQLADRIVYFPIRHHSPACAWHLKKVLDQVEPDAILIEGPRNANALLPLLAASETKAPVAIYTSYTHPRKGQRSARYAAYYPFCDYSPELVAIRAAQDRGCEVSFIDLSYPEMALTDSQHSKDVNRSLLDESYYRQSAQLRLACSRLGARDPDDLWDGLFETNFRDKPSETFIREVLAYCSLARHDQSESQLESEGTFAREAAMDDVIKAYPHQRVVVVTGGFHTVALASGNTPPPTRPAPKVTGEGQAVLIRYSFPQLDSLNGYASGMPMPGFYQKQWEKLEKSQTEILAELTVALARQLRKAGMGISPADEIACMTHSKQLAKLRSHALPSREDFLDGVRSVFVKGEHDVEGVSLLAAARKLLSGSSIGAVPLEAGRPPIIEDFFKQAAQHNLDADAVTAKEVSLDLYRKAAHRHSSHCLHQLTFLEVPFCTQAQGPDFVRGENLERVREVWKYVWVPEVEAALIELTVYGATLREAASQSLLARFEKAENVGRGRDAALATELLIEACRMGLHRDLDELLGRAGTLIQEDGRCVRVIAALGHLAILRSSLEPLQAHQLAAIPDLAEAAYCRACYLLPTLSSCPQDDLSSALEALKSLVEWAGALGDTTNWQTMRWSALQTLWRDSQDNPGVCGGAMGVLYAEGQMDEAAVASNLSGYLNASRSHDTGAQFLVGLLHTAREVLWQVPQVLHTLHKFLSDCEESSFQHAIPHLRLAFSGLSARETDQVARSVQDSLDVSKEDLRAAILFDSGDFEIASQMDAAVATILKKDQLEAWLEFRQE